MTARTVHGIDLAVMTRVTTRRIRECGAAMVVERGVAGGARQLATHDVAFMIEGSASERYRSPLDSQVTL
jgi:hypothetical protein